MFDDLRNAASDQPVKEPAAVQSASRKQKPRKKKLSEQRVFGMTASQRFTLVLFVLLLTCLLGVSFLILTESVYLPFL